MEIVFFHRHLGCGYSINKVTQTIIKDIPNKIEYYVPGRRAGLKDVLCNIFFILKNRNRSAINHITGDIHYGILGLIGCYSILTIHDTIFVDYNRISIFKRKLFEILWYRIPIKLASKVVCISEATKKSIMKYTEREDIVVIHNAIDNTINYYPRTFEIKDRYNVLVIGTAPNKNLINTFCALRDLPIFLTVVGRMNEEQINCLVSNKINYVSLEDLTDIEIDRCYASSDLVCFITLFEGFGMPILEANQSGCPIICSDIPVLHEVGGEAVAYTNPYSVKKMHDDIKCLLDSPKERERLVIAGLDNVKRFTPEVIRNQWLNLYNLK